MEIDLQETKTSVSSRNKEWEPNLTLSKLEVTGEQIGTRQVTITETDNITPTGGKNKTTRNFCHQSCHVNHWETN